MIVTMTVACKRSNPLEPGKIKQIRETSNVSQAVFSAVLNMSLSTVQKWEIEQNRPNGTALKLLELSVNKAEKP